MGLPGVSFPNIDQFNQKARDELYVKIDEFSKKEAEMLTDMNTLIDAGNTSTSVMTVALGRVTGLLATMEEDLSLIVDYVSQKNVDIAAQSANVDAVYEKLYNKIYIELKKLNAMIQDKTESFDPVIIYLGRILNKLEESRTIINRGTLVLPTSNNGILQKAVRLENNTSKVFRVIPVTVPVTIEQTEYVKVCSFSSLDQTYRNNNFKNSNIGVFLADINITGNNYCARGILHTGLISREKYGSVFNAEYAFNGYESFAFKIFKNDSNNEIVIAFKLDETVDKLKTLMLFEFGIDLLLGENLTIANLGEKFITSGYTEVGEIRATDYFSHGVLSQNNNTHKSLLGPNSDVIPIYNKAQVKTIMNRVSFTYDTVNYSLFIGNKFIALYNKDSNKFITSLFYDLVYKSGIKLYDTTTYGIMYDAIFYENKLYLFTTGHYVFCYDIFNTKNFSILGQPSDLGLDSFDIENCKNINTVRPLVSDNNIIIPCGSKISYYNFSTLAWTTFASSNSIFSALSMGTNEYITSFAISEVKSARVLYIGTTSNNIYSFSFNSGTWTKILANDDTSQYVSCLLVGSDFSTLYVGFFNGTYASFDIVNSVWYKHGSTTKFASTDAIVSKYSLGTITCLSEDTVNKKIIISHNGGNTAFIRYDISTMILDSFTNSLMDVNSKVEYDDSCKYYVSYTFNKDINKLNHFIQTYDPIFNEWQIGIEPTNELAITNEIDYSDYIKYHIEITPEEFSAQAVALNGNEDASILGLVSGTKKQDGKLLYNAFNRSGIPFNIPIKSFGCIFVDGYKIPICSVVLLDSGAILFEIDFTKSITNLFSLDSIDNVYPGIVFGDCDYTGIINYNSSNKLITVQYVNIVMIFDKNNSRTISE